jgi:hypothetical protein
MPVPKLVSFVVLGDGNGLVDWTAQRGEKPTVYCFVPADKFSRPTYRLIRTLNEQIQAVQPDATIVATWITADPAESKAYLDRAQNSLRGDRTSYGVYEENASGPGEWGINTDADITVVVVNKGQVKKSFGFVAANETVAEQVLNELK